MWNKSAIAIALAAIAVFAIVVLRAEIPMLVYSDGAVEFQGGTLMRTNELSATNQFKAKAAAVNSVENFDVDGRLLRALAEAMMDEINIVRTNPTAVLPVRTLAQLKTTIKNKVLAQPDSAP